VGDPNRLFNLVTLSFLSTGGDGYPAFVFQNVESLGDLPTPPTLNQANLVAGGEQDALAEYLQVFHPNPARAYREVDTPPELDERVQDLALRTDTVFTPPAREGIFDYYQMLRAGYLNNLSPELSGVELGGLPLAAFYDEAYYHNQYPDIDRVVSQGETSNGFTAFSHFINAGIFEGRNPSTLYNETYYLQDNPDVAAAVSQGGFRSGLEHYINFGHREGRSPSPLFDELLYRGSIPGVATAINNGAFESGFDHYITTGAQEGRDPLLSLYNEQYYLTTYPDVARDVQRGGWIDGLQHYLLFGQGEGRNPSSLFNEADYLALHADVARDVQLGNWRSGFQHYVSFGRGENRQVFL
jgi:hypothetical protein